jgi:hypothetical protein
VLPGHNHYFMVLRDQQSSLKVVWQQAFLRNENFLTSF